MDFGAFCYIDTNSSTLHRMLYHIDVMSPFGRFVMTMDGVVEDLVPLPVGAVGIDSLGRLEVADGAAHVIQEALSLHVRIAGAAEGAVHSTLGEGHAAGHGGGTLGRESCRVGHGHGLVFSNSKSNTGTPS